MRYALDEESDLVVVEIDKDFLREATARPWAPWAMAPTDDQLLVLGETRSVGWADRLIGERISIGKAKALIALGHRQTRKQALRRHHGI